MDLSAASDALQKRPWLVLAGLVAIPVYVVPVGFFGVRALWPRVLRDATTGAIALGVLSLVGLGVGGVSRVKAQVQRRPESERWKLPLQGMHMPEEFAASAASGH